MKNSSSDPALTSSYAPPKNVKKIQKGDKGYALVKKAFRSVSEKSVKDFESWKADQQDKK